jgi:hypothetical protein
MRAFFLILCGLMIARNLFELYRYRTLYPCLLIIFWSLILLNNLVKSWGLVGIAVITLVSAVALRKQFQRQQAEVQKLMTVTTTEANQESNS